MSWLEVIGLLTVIFMGILFLNWFFGEVDKNTKNIELEKQRIRESSSRAKKQEEWKNENSEYLGGLKKQDEKISKQNDELRIQQGEIHDETTELLYELFFKRTSSKKVVDRLKQIDPRKWGGMEVPEGAESKKYCSEELPWDNEISEKPADTNIATRNIEDIFKIFNIPACELSLMYSSFRGSIIKSGHPHNWVFNEEALARVNAWLTEQEIELARSSLHQAVINSIIVKLEMLKNIAFRRNTKPVYLE